MTHQIPKADHPWRQYANVPKKVSEKEKKVVKSLRKFLREIVVSWDKVQITTSAYSSLNRFQLHELSDKKVAAWLIGILKRNYA